LSGTRYQAQWASSLAGLDSAAGEEIFSILKVWTTRVLDDQDITMKFQRYLGVPVLVAGLWLAPSALGVNRDMVQLQTQVQQLQDQMTHMQQSFDERMGVMNNLVEKSADSANKVAATVGELQSTLQKQQTDSGGRVEQLSGQIQALNDSLDELKARLAKIGKQLEDMQAAQQNLNNPQTTTPGQPGTPGQAPQVAAPPPDILYNNALRDYNAGKNDLAAQEFGDYVKFYPTTDLAGNAYYYLADMEFRQGNFQQAAKDYDQVLQNFPTGNKAAAAQLKKGFSLIELGEKDEGISELRRVIQRYPRSSEALQARERLRKLGVSAGTTASRGE
jgi:tol-pal system protein YbgF